MKLKYDEFIFKGNQRCLDCEFGFAINLLDAAENIVFIIYKHPIPNMINKIEIIFHLSIIKQI